MEKLALKLMSYGMDFQYENWNSEGEQITSFEVNLRVTNQQGKIYFDYCGQTDSFPENDGNFEHLESKLDKILIEETT